jgi:hypothetical protein
MNIVRYPVDFIFKLTLEERIYLILKNEISGFHGLEEFNLLYFLEKEQRIIQCIEK